MSDMALAEDVRDLKGKYDEVEERLDGHSFTIDRILKWALTGNGDSAEQRLKVEEIRGARLDTEMTALKACVEQAIAPENISHIAKEAVKAFVTNARDRDRTTVAKLRAIGPMLAGIAAVIASLVTFIAIFWGRA